MLGKESACRRTPDRDLGEKPGGWVRGERGSGSGTRTHTHTHTYIEWKVLFLIGLKYFYWLAVYCGTEACETAVMECDGLTLQLWVWSPSASVLGNIPSGSRKNCVSASSAALLCTHTHTHTHTHTQLDWKQNIMWSSDCQPQLYSEV